MASSDALWNEVARLLNIEFFNNGQAITGAMLLEIVIYTRDVLTDESASD